MSWYLGGVCLLDVKSWGGHMSKKMCVFVFFFFFLHIYVLSAFHLRILRSTCVPSAFHLRSICVPSAFHICPIGPLGPCPLAHGPWPIGPMGPCPLAHGPWPMGPCPWVLAHWEVRNLRNCLLSNEILTSEEYSLISGESVFCSHMRICPKMKSVILPR